MKKKITETQLRSIIYEAVKKTLQETPQFEKGWDDDMKRERRTANFVDDVYGKGCNPYDVAPQFANAIDAMMNNTRIAKHKSNRGVGKIKEGIDWFHENDSPSPLEEEFQDAFYNVIEQYKEEFLSHGWMPQDFAKWCCEMVNEYILSH